MIFGLADLNKDKKKDDKDKKTTNSFTGGQSSGLNVENPPDNKEGFSKQDNKIKLTAWKNGFQIDDGEFRSIESDENNKKFMDEVNKGYIPQELVSKGYKDLGIMLEDKK
jgi:UBX domain-containing protein 1